MLTHYCFLADEFIRKSASIVLEVNILEGEVALGYILFDTLPNVRGLV